MNIIDADDEKKDEEEDDEWWWENADYRQTWQKMAFLATAEVITGAFVFLTPWVGIQPHSFVTSLHPLHTYPKQGWKQRRKFQMLVRVVTTQ